MQSKLLISKSNSVAFLADNDLKKLELCLSKIAKQQFDVVDAPLLEASYRGKKYYAFMDFYVYKSVDTSTIGCKIEISDRVIEDFCDGAIVCTPIGSTGYNSSEGGIIIPWGENKLGINFIAPLHERSKRGIVISARHTVNLSLRGSKPARLYADNVVVADLVPSEVVTCRVSDVVLKIIRVNPESMQEKMNKRWQKIKNITGNSSTHESLVDLAHDLI